MPFCLRELSTFSTSWLLLDAGAALPKGLIELQKLEVTPEVFWSSALFFFASISMPVWGFASGVFLSSEDENGFTLSATRRRKLFSSPGSSYTKSVLATRFGMSLPLLSAIWDGASAAP